MENVALPQEWQRFITGRDACGTIGENAVYFKYKKEDEENGYKPCKVCKP